MSKFATRAVRHIQNSTIVELFGEIRDEHIHNWLLLVHLKWTLTGININWYWASSGHCLFQCLFITTANSNYTSHYSTNSTWVESAVVLLIKETQWLMCYVIIMAYPRYIRISLFSVDAIIVDDVHESFIHISTSTAMISIWHCKNNYVNYYVLTMLN